MEFDINRVYTSVNADELKVGSRVLVSNCISELKELVTNYEDERVRTLLDICSESSLSGRFETVTNVYQFAYLIEPPEEKKLKWTDLKIGDVIKEQNSELELMVTKIDKHIGTDRHIGTDSLWITDTRLAEHWEKVE